MKKTSQESLKTINKHLPTFFWSSKARTSDEREWWWWFELKINTTRVNVVDLNSGTIRRKVGFSEYTFFDDT